MKQMLMSQLAVQIRGVSYKPDDLHKGLDENSIALLRANNIDDGEINFNDLVYVDRSKVSNNQLLRQGDILICASSGSKNLVGKAAQVDFNREITFGAFCKVVRPTAVESDYLGMYFQSPIYRKIVSSLAQGANINNIKNADIDNLLVNIPNNDTQKKIVEIFKRMQSIIRNRQQQLQKLDELIKARFVELFGSVDDNQKDIKTIRVGDACTLINGRAFKPDEWSTEGLPIVRIQNLNSEEAPFNYYSGEVKSQHLINSGDLLFSWSGTPGTSFGAFFWRRGKAALNQHIFKVIPNCDYNLFFLQYALNERLNFIISRAHGGVGLQHITKKELDEVLLFQPGINEQNDFATFVEQVDKSKVAVQKSLDEAQLLFDSLMQQYFG